VETPDGHLLVPNDPEVDMPLKLGQEFIANYPGTFRALPK
jgi:hypothetical protein